MTVSDISGEAVLRLSQDAATGGWMATPLVMRAGGANGQAYLPDGRLITCQMLDGKIIEVVHENGAYAIRTVVPGVDGAARPGFNDIVASADGSLWFSNMGNKVNPEFAGVYWTAVSGGPVVQVVRNVAKPNGVRLSPDGKSLYVVSYTKPELWAFPVLGPGKLGEGRVLAALAKADGSPAKGGDGLAVDSKGNLWVALPEANALQVIDAAGHTLGHVAVPENPSNCAFATADGRMLFITARSSVYGLPTLVEGWWPARGGPGVGPGLGAAPAAAPAAPAVPAAPAAPGTR
jgi:gluconolactonase